MKCTQPTRFSIRNGRHFPGYEQNINRTICPFCAAMRRMSESTPPPRSMNRSPEDRLIHLMFPWCRGSRSQPLTSMYLVTENIYSRFSPWVRYLKRTKKQCCLWQFRYITQFAMGIMSENLLRYCKPKSTNLMCNTIISADTTASYLAL